MGSVFIKMASVTSVTHQAVSWVLLGKFATALTGDFAYILSACSAAVAIVMPRHEHTTFTQLASLALMFTVPTLILSNGTQSLFYVVHSTLLLLWIRIEHVLSAPQGPAAKYHVSSGRNDALLTELRIGLFALFFGQLAFFGVAE